MILPAHANAENNGEAKQLSGVVAELSIYYEPGVVSDDYRQWVTFHVWREHDGSIRTNELSVEFSADTEGDRSRIASAFPEGKVVRFSIDGDVKQINDAPEAMLHIPLGEVDDPGLLEAAKRILYPAPIVDDDLGRFEVLAPDHKTFNQSRRWLGRDIQIFLFLNRRRENPQKASLATLRKAWREKKAWDKRARAELSEHFQPFVREETDRLGLEPATVEAFANSLSLVSVHIYADETFYLLYKTDILPNVPIWTFEVYRGSQTGVSID